MTRISRAAVALFATLVAAPPIAVAAPPQVQYVQIKPATVSGGEQVEVIVTLNRKATVVVKLNSSDPKLVAIPPNYALSFDNARTRSAYFPVGNPPLYPAGGGHPVIVTANAGPGEKQASVTVTAAAPADPFPSLTRTTYRVTRASMPDLLKLASSKGFVFDASKTAGSKQNSCALRADRNGLRLEAVTRQPLPGGVWTMESVTCVFKVLEGPFKLKPEWTFKGVTLTTEYDANRWSYLDAPKPGTNDPGFTIRVLNEMPHGTPEYVLVVREIELEGPGGRTWKDAF